MSRNEESSRRAAAGLLAEEVAVAGGAAAFNRCLAILLAEGRTIVSRGAYNHETRAAGLTRVAAGYIAQLLTARMQDGVHYRGMGFRRGMIKIIGFAKITG
jgi:hypothetical protein